MENSTENKSNATQTNDNTAAKITTKTPIFKKWWFWAIIGVIVIAIIGGGASNSSTDNQSGGSSSSGNQGGSNSSGNSSSVTENNGNNAPCSHAFKAATCTEPQTCSKCGETKGSALGHTTSTGTCTRCKVSFSKWEKRYYVDEFNNPTSNAFIAPKDTISGTFSNSATTNSRLNAYVRVNNEDCEIMLWEYGSSMVKAYSTTDYDITILLPNGTKKYFTGTMYKNGTVICFDNYSEIISLLKNTDGILKFYIQEDSEYGVNSTYLFEVNTSGFKDLYNQTFK